MNASPCSSMIEGLKGIARDSESLIRRLKGKVSQKALTPLQHIVDVRRRSDVKIVNARVPSSQSEIAFLDEISMLQNSIIKDTSIPYKLVDQKYRSNAEQRAQLNEQLEYSTLHGESILSEVLRTAAMKILTIIKEWSQYLENKFRKSDSWIAVKTIVEALYKFRNTMNEKLKKMPEITLPPRPQFRGSSLSLQKSDVIESGTKRRKIEGENIKNDGKKLWKKEMAILNPPIIIKPVLVQPPKNHKSIKDKNANDKSHSFTVHVIRDDVLEGGTKQRALVTLLQNSDAMEFVYAGPVEGFAQIALAYVAKICVVVAKQSRGGFHHLTTRAMKFGANIVEVPKPNDLKNVQRYATTYVRQQQNRFPGKTVLLPFGLHCEEFVQGLAQSISSALPTETSEELLRPYKLLCSTGGQPKRLWLVAGSATLLASFARLWPDTHFLVVQVGKKIWPDQLVSHAPFCAKMSGDWKASCNASCRKISSTLYIAPEAFGEVAKFQPPYPTVRTYDAKLWQFVLAHGEDGDYIWNVGGDRS